MHRIDEATAVNGLFTDGDPQLGTPGTVVDADWLNAVQEEIANVIEAAGEELVKADNTQLSTVIAGLISAAITANKVYSGRINGYGGDSDLPAGWAVTINGTGDYTVTHNLGIKLWPVASVMNMANHLAIVMSVDVNSFNVNVKAAADGSVATAYVIFHAAA